MTRDEYREFEAAFHESTAGLRFRSCGSCIEQCEDCPRDIPYEDGVSYDHEPWFSWKPCECCHSTLGGNRKAMHAWKQHADGESIIHLVVCMDCAYYNECGRLDDMTMLSIEGGEVAR